LTQIKRRVFSFPICVNLSGYLRAKTPGIKVRQVRWTPSRPRRKTRRVLKFTISRTETRIIRGTARQIGGSSGGISQSIENRFVLREEIDRRLAVTCELSPIPQGALARILKAVATWPKKLFLRLLKGLQFPFTP
jgi:hypothetical protein